MFYNFIINNFKLLHLTNIIRVLIWAITKSTLYQTLTLCTILRTNIAG